MSVELPNKSIPWMTKDGFLDIAKFAIEGILQQAMELDARSFESGVAMLRTMYGLGRNEAGVFLLGLLVASPDDLDRRLVIVEGSIATAGPMYRWKRHWRA